jgi:hypothetical protein
MPRGSWTALVVVGVTGQMCLLVECQARGARISVGERAGSIQVVSAMALTPHASDRVALVCCTA